MTTGRLREWRLLRRAAAIATLALTVHCGRQPPAAQDDLERAAARYVDLVASLRPGQSYDEIADALVIAAGTAEIAETRAW